MSSFFKILTSIGLVLSFTNNCIAQEQEDIHLKAEKILTISENYSPLDPAKAAFYSAILPGAGQVYNKKYIWQIPTIYGLLGWTSYLYYTNNKLYYTYRESYNRRKLGIPDRFDGKKGRKYISARGLESAQKTHRRERELSMIYIVAIYALQIVEANVTAHLMLFDDTDNLTIGPTSIQPQQQILINDLVDSNNVGLSIKYTF